MPDPAAALPEIDAIQSAVVPDRNRVRLILRLRNAADWELFFALCSDLARALRVAGVESGLAAVARRLAKWRDFLRTTRRRLLSDKRIRGLLAELRFLEGAIAPRLGWRAAVAAWTGPLGMPQDFSTGGTAVEVKAKLNTARRRVRISSSAQLDVPTGRVLFLHVSTFGIAGEDDGNSDSLADAVSRMREVIASDAETVEAFDDRLLAVGYAEAELYEQLRFIPAEEEVFRVVEGFPRLVPSSLPQGVLDAAYDIDLASCAPFAVPSEWYDK